MLSAPIVEEGKSDREVYFPKSNETEFWYTLTLNKSRGVQFSPELKYYKGESTYTISNELPATPPTFLRSGRLILVNEPTMRTADLSNSYTILAALSPISFRASGSFLAAKNFTDNAQIDSCVANGCTIKFNLHKDLGDTYVLEWNYIGRNANVDINIGVSRVLIVSEDHLY